MTTLRTAALALALTAAAVTAHAGVNASAIRPGNWLTSSPAEVFVPLDAAGATTLTFDLGSAGKKVLTYSAECAVDETQGLPFSWVELNIYVNGALVKPTGDSFAFFCYSNATTGFDGWTRASITVPIKGIEGTNAVRIKAKGNSSATRLWLGDSALVVYD
jgi:hypothetical protein